MRKRARMLSRQILNAHSVHAVHRGVAECDGASDEKNVAARNAPINTPKASTKFQDSAFSRN